MSSNQKSDTPARLPIGGSNTRIDTADKVTGRTQYVEDMQLPGLLHAVVLRSPHHHARLLSLDASAAAGMPGVVRIITAADVPGLNGLDGYSRDEPVLTPVGDTLRQRGAPIAMILAESRAQAQAAARTIRVEYEVLPHTFDAEAALAADAEPIYPSGNVLNSYAVKHGDIDAAFAGSDVIVETSYRTAFQEHSTLERVATLGTIGEDGRVTVHGGTHEPHWQQGYIAQVLGLDIGQVRVILPPTGGSFGDRQDPWPLVAAGLATHLTRRPVRLAYARREAFDATPKRHLYHTWLKIGATADGRLTGIHVRIAANTGGYDSAGYWISNYAATAAGGPYVWQAVDAYARAIYTNAPKCGQFRGYGSPQSTFASECALDELCQRLGADPLEFRLANRIHPDSISYLGYKVAETLGYAEALEALRPRYAEYRREADAFNAGHDPRDLRMGVGLAGMWYRFGKSGSLRVETHAELASDGHFTVYCSAPDYGQGISTVMLQLASDALGVSRDRIELVNADTALTPDSGIQGASRATYFIGSSVRDAVTHLRQELLGVAAELLDCEPASLTLEADRVGVSGDPARGISLAKIVAEFDALGKPRKLLGVFDLSPLFPEESRPEYVPLFTTGAQVAQVVVDMATGQAQVRRLAAAHDVGHAINPPNAIGQIQGGVMMGVGTALTEQYVPGLSTGFTDYILPMIGETPEIEVILVEVPSFHGALGAKGLGEAAILPTAPAIINALSRAIGARIRELPATPPRVLKAIKPMNSQNKHRRRTASMTHRAILSVYDKTGLVELARGLVGLDFELVASGGTARALSAAGLPVTQVDEVTGFPEILGGRVKTLHPAVQGGILARRTPEHLAELAAHSITPVDLVVCNLYPFAATITRPGVTEAEAVEEIDIGGVALLRAAAKNFESVAVLCDPADYEDVLAALRDGMLDANRRRGLALKAFRHTAAYDTTIATWLAQTGAGERESGGVGEQGLPAQLVLAAERAQTLRYGENPHQQAALYRWIGTAPAFEQLQGKELSYNNLIDLEAAWAMPQDFAEPAVAIIKHTNPSGLATAGDALEAYRLAFACDPVSAFGSIIAGNREIDLPLVQEIGSLFVEVLAAPAYTPDALAWLAAHKKNCRVMLARGGGRSDIPVLRSVAGGLLAQTPDDRGVDEGAWRVVTRRQPTDAERHSLVFAWLAVKHVKSNAIVFVQGTATVGVGAGQMNRVDAVYLAARRAGDRAKGAVMGSDAFIPFPDSIETAGTAGVTACIQPGGSLRDEEAIAAADKWGMAMIFTGERHFRH